MFPPILNAPAILPSFWGSEYTQEVDFLPNHDSADAVGQAAFLTNTNDNLFL